jgi:hypothetical protein
MAIYAAVAITWFVPDRRLERILAMESDSR